MVPTTNPKVGVLIEGMDVAPPTRMDIEVVEMALIIASLALPIIVGRRRCKRPNTRCLH